MQEWPRRIYEHAILTIRNVWCRNTARPITRSPNFLQTRWLLQNMHHFRLGNFPYRPGCSNMPVDPTHPVKMKKPHPDAEDQYEAGEGNRRDAEIKRELTCS